jgi:hypothetical protein
VIVLQGLLVFLSASANLRIPLSLEGWRCVMHTCLESLPLQGFTPQLATSIIWSGSVYGYLEDPSTAECLAELRRRAEQLARSGLQAELARHLHQAVRQASVTSRLLLILHSFKWPVVGLMLTTGLCCCRPCTAWSPRQLCMPSFRRSCLPCPH